MIDNAAPLKDQKKIKTIEKVCVILLVAPTMPRFCSSHRLCRDDSNALSSFARVGPEHKL